MANDSVTTEELLEALERREKATSKWYVGPMVTVVLLIIGLAVNWGITLKTVEALEADIATLEGQVARNQSEIIDLKVNNASKDQTIQQIRDDVKEIKDDVKSLTRSRYRGNRK